MNLYLDDDMKNPLLAQYLRQAGHDVQIPADAGLDGAEDPEHLTHTIKVDRVLLTGNHGDFELLHNLIEQARGHHPGILVVRRDNDPSRDLTLKGIVRALTKLLAAGVPVADQCIVLNHWR